MWSTCCFFQTTFGQENSKQLLQVADSIYYSGNHDDALPAYLKVINYCEKSKELACDTSSFWSYCILSSISRQGGRYIDGLEYVNQALSLAKNLEDSLLMSYGFVYKGNLFFEEFEKDSTKKKAPVQARNNFYKAYKYQQSRKDSIAMISSMDNLGNTFIQTNEIDSALFWLERAHVIAKKKQRIISMVNIAQNKAKILSSNKRLKEARVEALYALSYTDSLNTPNSRYSLHYLLGDILAEMNRHEEANRYYQSGREAEFAFKQNQNQEILYEVQEKYNNEKLAREKLEVEVRASRNRSAAYGLGGLFALSLGALLYYNARFRYRRKNMQLELQQKEQEAEIKAINAMVDGREIEREEIARTLHDSVTTLLTSANMHLEVLKVEENLENSLVNKTQTMLDDITDKVRNLSHNLLSDVLIKYGLSKATEDLCSKLSTSALPFEFSSNLTDQRFEKSIEMKLFNITQELCNNVLKHSRASAAVVELFEEDQLLTLRVFDNGKGFNPEQLEQAGLGLNQIRARVRAMNGTMDIHSIANTKTEILITLITKP